MSQIVSLPYRQVARNGKHATHLLYGSCFLPLKVLVDLVFMSQVVVDRTVNLNQKQRRKLVDYLLCRAPEIEMVDDRVDRNPRTGNPDRTIIPPG
jgi:hypothetical protein